MRFQQDLDHFSKTYRLKSPIELIDCMPDISACIISWSSDQATTDQLVKEIESLAYVKSLTPDELEQWIPEIPTLIPLPDHTDRPQ